MVSGVSIFNFSTLRKRLSLLRSSIGVHLLCGFGTKKYLVEKNQRTSSTVFLSIS